MILRKGRTKSILESAVDSALLAVEVFNKPRTAFRTQAYIALMVIAWTRLFHAHFQQTIGEKYYYKKKGSNRYDLVDGDRKSWELKTCIRKYDALSNAEIANLELFIRLRNKIEHRNIEKRELDILLFGECQALLFNFENLLVKLFSSEYSINENLSYSLQFSTLRTEEQDRATKRALSSDFADIKKFVEMYRSNLSQKVFDSQEYSIKLIQVPKISNTNRNDLAIEFVKWNALNAEDKEAYGKLNAIVKDKIIKHEVINMGGMKPGKVLELVKQKSGKKLSHHDHRCLFTIFGVRPASGSEKDPFDTETRYCHYDEVHKDYVYHQPWVDTIIAMLNADKMKKYMWIQAYKQGRTYQIDEYI
ncbi:MAG: DUF3644 domain-containing protein [Gammaproteobacteria bacterium]